MAPDLWFPPRGDHTRIAVARAVCATCTVRGECLDDAVVNDTKFGIWGGLSERQRQAVRRRRGLVHTRSRRGTGGFEGHEHEDIA
jgi:WhiB family redox-sensing transcriptional regulator